VLLGVLAAAIGLTTWRERREVAALVGARLAEGDRLLAAAAALDA
jgi:hypothetical protein